MEITEEDLLSNQTSYINKSIKPYFVSLGLNLTERSYLYPDCNNYHKIYLVRINNNALGFTVNDRIFFNILEFENKSNNSIKYLASLLVSIYAHESTNHDIIDYEFVPPIKEVQQQLNKYYNKNNHNEETLPCYFSLALLGCKNSADELYKGGKGLILNQYYILRDNIERDVKRHLKIDY